MDWDALSIRGNSEDDSILCCLATLLRGSPLSQDLGTSTEMARESWDEKHLNFPGAGDSSSHESGSCHLSSKTQSSRMPPSLPVSVFAV